MGVQQVSLFHSAVLTQILFEYVKNYKIMLSPHLSPSLSFSPLPSLPLALSLFLQESGLVCPFVEVRFMNETMRTTTACGSHPHWNEEVSFPFQ